MFTWIPIHEETAKRLLEFKDRQHELIAILARMHEAGMKASSITDKNAADHQFQLKEIDPFTFLANFNRGVRDDNRQAMWQFLKDDWKLVAEVPGDFDGLPLADMRSSWLLPYAAKRAPEHVGLSHSIVLKNLGAFIEVTPIELHEPGETHDWDGDPHRIRQTWTFPRSRRPFLYKLT